jgi:hypothetical protein
MPDLLRPKQLAQYLPLSQGSVYRLLERRDIPGDDVALRDRPSLAGADRGRVEIRGKGVLGQIWHVASVSHASRARSSA